MKERGRVVRHGDALAVCGISSRQEQCDNRLQFVDWELADWPLIYAGIVDQSLILEMPGEFASLPQIVEIDNATLRARLQDIRVRKEQAPFELGARLKGIRCEVEAFLDENAVTFTENAGVRLGGWSSTGTTINLSVQPVSFRTTLCSNMQMERVLKTGSTLRSYLHWQGTLESLSESVLANPMGVDILLFTADGQMIVQKRSDKMAIRPGALAPSVSGGFDWDDVASDDVISFADVPIWREMVEELGVPRDALLDIQFLGITRELARGGQPEAFFCGVLSMSKDEIIERWESAADSWEASRLHFCPLGELAVRPLKTSEEVEELDRSIASLNEEMLEEASVTLQANISLWQSWKRGELG